MVEVLIVSNDCIVIDFLGRILVFFFFENICFVKFVNDLIFIFLVLCFFEILGKNFKVFILCFFINESLLRGVIFVFDK